MGILHLYLALHIMDQTLKTQGSVVIKVGSVEPQWSRCYVENTEPYHMDSISPLCGNPNVDQHFFAGPPTNWGLITS